MTAVQIDGVLHEFSSVPGVREDVTDIVLNIKQLALRMHGEGPKRMMLTATGPGEVRAGQIQAGHDIDIMNPDLVLCTLDEGAKLGMELTVQLGRGYEPASANRPEDAPIGLIPVDAIYSPVRRVAYKVEPTRVGQVTDYDKLVLNGGDEWRRGAGGCGGFGRAYSAGPAEAVRQLRRAAAGACRGASRRSAVQPQFASQGGRAGAFRAFGQLPEERQYRLYRRPGAEDEQEMLRTPNFGRKSLNEIKEVLTNMGLALGMNVTGWPPENIEDLAKRLDEPF